MQKYNLFVKNLSKNNTRFYRLVDGFTENDFVWQMMYGEHYGRLMIYRKRFSTIEKSYNIKLQALNSCIYIELLIGLRKT